MCVGDITEYTIIHILKNWWKTLIPRGQKIQSLQSKIFADLKPFLDLVQLFWNGGYDWRIKRWYNISWDGLFKLWYNESHHFCWACNMPGWRQKWTSNKRTLFCTMFCTWIVLQLFIEKRGETLTWKLISYNMDTGWYGILSLLILTINTFTWYYSRRCGGLVVKSPCLWITRPGFESWPWASPQRGLRGGRSHCNTV